MQLLVVVTVMPSLMMLSRTTFYTLFRVVGASFAAIAAGGWGVERTTAINLHVDHAVDSFAQHSTALALLLFVLALVAFTCSRTRPLRVGRQ